MHTISHIHRLGRSPRAHTMCNLSWRGYKSNYLPQHKISNLTAIAMAIAIAQSRAQHDDFFLSTQRHNKFRNNLIATKALQFRTSSLLINIQHITRWFATFVYSILLLLLFLPLYKCQMWPDWIDRPVGPERLWWSMGMRASGWQRGGGNMSSSHMHFWQFHFDWHFSTRRSRDFNHAKSSRSEKKEKHVRCAPNPIRFVRTISGTDFDTHTYDRCRTANDCALWSRPFAIRIAYQPMMRRVAHTYCIDDDDDDHRAPLPLCLRVKSNFPKQMG